ncbi:hypothetical protein ACWIGW_40115 [Nocardia brasiliensis]
MDRERGYGFSCCQGEFSVDVSGGEAVDGAADPHRVSRGRRDVGAHPIYDHLGEFDSTTDDFVGACRTNQQRPVQLRESASPFEDQVVTRPNATFSAEGSEKSMPVRQKHSTSAGLDNPEPWLHRDSLRSLASLRSMSPTVGPSRLSGQRT